MDGSECRERLVDPSGASATWTAPGLTNWTSRVTGFEPIPGTDREVTWTRPPVTRQAADVGPCVP